MGESEIPFLDADGNINRAWKTGNNARAKEFWQPIAAVFRDLDHAMLHEVVRLVWQDGLTMEMLGEHFRPRLPVTWEARKDMIVGLRLYQHALTVLDLYDDDFRPKKGT